MNIIRLNSIGEPFAKSGQATPPSGNGGLLYLRVDDVTDKVAASTLFMYVPLLTPVALIKISFNGNTGVFNVPSALEIGSEDVLNSLEQLAFGVLIDTSYMSNDGVLREIHTKDDVETLLASVLGTKPQLSEITKEQFYTL